MDFHTICISKQLELVLITWHISSTRVRTDFWIQTSRFFSTTIISVFLDSRFSNIWSIETLKGNYQNQSFLLMYCKRKVIRVQCRHREFWNFSFYEKNARLKEIWPREKVHLQSTCCSLRKTSIFLPFFQIFSPFIRLFLVSKNCVANLKTFRIQDFAEHLNLYFLYIYYLSIFSLTKLKELHFHLNDYSSYYAQNVFFERPMSNIFMKVSLNKVLP